MWDGANEYTWILVETRIYTPKKLDPNSWETFQFTNTDFEQSKKIQANLSNPQFSIENQKILQNTDQTFHTRYSYRVNGSLNTKDLWILRNTVNPDAYYLVSYGSDGWFNKEIVKQSTKVLDEIAASIESF